MMSQNTTVYPPVSLQRLAASLIKQGYVVGLKRARASIPWHGPDAVSTTSGWRLTWSRRTTSSWEEFGSLWEADGAAPSLITTPFISESTGFHVAADQVPD